MDEPIVLCIETATKNCSVALYEGADCIAHRQEWAEQYSHAESLHVFIDEVLEDAGLEPEDIDLIALSDGPGSYTGLRIGAATAKGMGFALSIPVVTVSSLDVLAAEWFASEPAPGSLLLSNLDARRMEAYVTWFSASGEKLTGINPVIFDEESVQEIKEEYGSFFLAGDASEKIFLKFEGRAINTGIDYPDARYMIYAALEKYDQGEFSDLAYFEPNYIKDFQPGVPKKLI